MRNNSWICFQYVTMKKKLFVSIVLIIAISAICTALEFLTNNLSYKEDIVSFYYGDSLPVSKLLNRYPGYRIIKTDSLLCVRDDDIIFRYKGDCFGYDVNTMHAIVCMVNDNGNTIDVPINIRSWKEGKYGLIEIDAKSNGYLSRFIRRCAASITSRGIMNMTEYSVLLLTQDDTSYIAENGKIYYETTHSKGIVCDSYKMKTPVYYQMIKKGDVVILRNEDIIDVSTDNMKSWESIYCGKRGIKESMYYREEDSTVVFTQYTPGMDHFDRHYVLGVNINSSKIDTIMTFYSYDDNSRDKLEPFCRHIHVMMEDPYTGFIYLGTGDSDRASNIYRSTDKGHTFTKILGGRQVYRTLTFMFTKDSIYWGTDSERNPQYISSMSKYPCCDIPDTIPIRRYPLINSALWCSTYSPEFDIYILSSNSEGCYYDQHHRLYGIKYSNDGAPTFYNLLAEKSIKLPYHQLFVQGVDVNNNIWAYDTELGYTRKFKIERYERN